MHHHHRSSTSITIGGNFGALINILGLLFVGLLLLGMGVVFVGVAMRVPILRSSFLLTGGIFGVIGVAIVGIGILLGFRKWNAQRLRASGIPGQAQIVGLTQTGFYVNGQPVVEMQLQVTTAMHAPYAVSRRETVPAMMIGCLTSGQPLPVMVDPAQPQNLVILWESALNVPAGGFLG
jgi:hypothetical protein